MLLLVATGYNLKKWLKFTAPKKYQSNDANDSKSFKGLWAYQKQFIATRFKANTHSKKFSITGVFCKKLKIDVN